MKRLGRFALFLGLLVLPACLPIPDTRQGLELPEPLYQLPPEQVRVDYLTLPGYPEPHTPTRYNRAAYLRYYAGPEPAGTVIVLMPGIFGGAASLDIYARQLVAAGEGLEVWAVDRRANLLEDRAVYLESLRTGNPRLAYDYYVTNAGKEGGFVPLAPQEVPFLAFWGLEVHLHDLDAVVRRARESATRVVLGGHSLGASIVSLYAAYDFGEPGRQEPGYRAIDGLILIDGSLGRTGGYAIDDPSFRIGPLTLIPSIAELEAGLASPYFNWVGRTPYSSARQEAAALLALYDPEGLSPGGLFDFPVTNRAATGLMIDDHYASSTVFSASVGRALHAKVAGNLAAVLLGGWEGVSSQSVVGVAPGYDYVDWERGDKARERTDLDSLLKALAMPEANFTEWYFPVRLLLDLSRLDPRLGEEGFVPSRTVPTPTLAVGAGRGLVSSLDSFSAYMNARPEAPFSAYILPGLTHHDIVMAEHNPLVPLSLLWLGGLRAARS
ncbi:MAG: hypothetical protein M3511_10815 [Deinococcota bacterium]|nr:hypothetical protein [Deinococcota bacterium]